MFWGGNGCSSMPLEEWIFLVVTVVVYAVLAGVFLISVWRRRRARRRERERLLSRNPVLFTTKKDRVEAMLAQEREEERQRWWRNAPWWARLYSSVRRRLTARAFMEATGRPTVLRLTADGVALGVFGAVVFAALFHVDYWSHPVPVVKSHIEEHEQIEFREPDNRPVIFTRQFFEVTDLTGRCCAEDTLARVPEAAAKGGYKVVFLSDHRMYPDQDRHAAPLRCDSSWSKAGALNLALARMMATVEHLQAPYPVDVWYVNTVPTLRDGDLYVGVPFLHACTLAGGCFSKYLLPGKPSIAAQDKLVYNDRLNSSDHRTPEEFLRVINGGSPWGNNGAYILDRQGRIRAEIEQVGDTSALDIIAALFEVARRDGQPLPDRLLSHFRSGGAGEYESTPSPYFERRVEDDAGPYPPRSYSEWLTRFNRSPWSVLVPGTGTFGEWSRRAPMPGFEYGLDDLRSEGGAAEGGRDDV